jgi:hypothetical protein
MEIYCLSTWYQVRICSAISVSRDIVGGVQVSRESEKFTYQSRARHFPNDADGKLFYRRPSLLCSCFALEQAYQRQKKLSSENCLVAKLRGIEFLT